MSDLTDRLTEYADRLDAMAVNPSAPPLITTVAMREAAARITELEAELDKARAQIAAALSRARNAGVEPESGTILAAVVAALSSPVTHPEPEPRFVELARPLGQSDAPVVAAHDAEVLAAADRRVAPDRVFAVMKERLTWPSLHWTIPDDDTLRALAQAVASGVLGIPADQETRYQRTVRVNIDAALEMIGPRPAVQRTADRETIIDALIQKNAHKVTENGRGGYRCTAGDFEVDWQQADLDRLRRHVAGFRADAVLAVLIPADLIRAEALEEAAGIAYKRTGGYETGIDLSARAAEYRKAAS